MSLIQTRKPHLRIPGTPYLIIAEIAIVKDKYGVLGIEESCSPAGRDSPAPGGIRP